MCMVFVMFFFFSSRRRHTRFDCDWSSDVCSSDLSVNAAALSNGERPLRTGDRDDVASVWTGSTMCLARIACTLWQSAFAPTGAAAARSATEMRLGKFTWSIVGSITGALTGVMRFTAALCLVASDIRALMASAGGGRRNDFHEARVWQRGVRTGH